MVCLRCETYPSLYLLMGISLGFSLVVIVWHVTQEFNGFIYFGVNVNRTVDDIFVLLTMEKLG